MRSKELVKGALDYFSDLASHCSTKSELFLVMERFEDRIKCYYYDQLISKKQALNALCDFSNICVRCNVV